MSRRYATGMIPRLVALLRTIVLIPTFFVVTLIMAVVVTVAARRDPSSPLLERAIELWARWFLAIPPLEWEVSGGDQLDPDRQYVVISNHLSNFDIPLMFKAIPVPIRFLAKKELFKVPLLGSAMADLGIVKIDRERGMSTHEAINAGVATARDRGFSLFIFPEGTRSRSGDMSRFWKGAFRIAIDNEMPLVPVVIHGTWEVNPPGKIIIQPGRARVVVLDPIDTSHLTKADVRRFQESTQDKMRAAFEEMRAG